VTPPLDALNGGVSETSRPPHIAIVSHDRSWHEYARRFVQTLVRRLNAEFLDIDDGWPPRIDAIADYRSLDAIVVFMRYRKLLVAEAIDWRGYSGLRVQLEHDAHTDPSFESPWRGTWARTFRRHQFDHLVVSGLRLVEHFEAQRIPVSWLPKGFDSDTLMDLGRRRNGIAHFGTLYRSRRAMLRALRSAGTPIRHLVMPYEQLNDALNDLSGVVVCNIDARARWWKFGRGLERYWPGTALELGEDVEPMIKTFEVAGAGCAPLIAPSPDLEPLGFIDGTTALIWRDFDELAYVVRHLQHDSERLGAIGSAASRLAHTRHTWSRRAAELADIIDRLRRA
jgi:glycosyltransferase involved in cell wall biosynthesis